MNVVLPDPPPPEEVLARDECERCRDRGDRYEAWAKGLPAGPGEGAPTLEEIRLAISALERADQLGAPYGPLVAIGSGKHKLRVCPRCTNVGTAEKPVSLFERYPDRRSRRGLRLR